MSRKGVAREHGPDIDAHQRGLLARLNNSEWRAPIYSELVARDIRRFGKPVTVLEIGCGMGFDGDVSLQRQMAERADRYIGVEPDRDVEPEPIFTELIRTPLESAGLEPGSVDVAYSIMVMEHLEEPIAFVEAIHRALRPGGVYWGFTVDRRHWYTYVANALTRLNLKSAYLDLLSGRRRGAGRYHDYPTAYRINCPRDLRRYEKLFTRVDSWNVGPFDSAAHYAPRALRSLVRGIERIRVRAGAPRTDFVVRVVR
ncbi:MAG: class I SAM-dependent methyltransferase [Gemmatimonadota bacterium]